MKKNRKSNRHYRALLFCGAEKKRATTKSATHNNKARMADRPALRPMLAASSSAYHAGGDAYEDLLYVDVESVEGAEHSAASRRRTAAIVRAVAAAAVTAVTAVLAVSLYRSSSGGGSSSSRDALSAALITTSSSPPPPASNVKHPNVVFILADDMGYNSLRPDITPFLARLRDGGVSLTNYYTQELCTPARASLLTGRYPLSVGLQHGSINVKTNGTLPLDETTVADVLKASGYTNYMLGKWNLGNASPRYVFPALWFAHTCERPCHPHLLHCLFPGNCPLRVVSTTSWASSPPSRTTGASLFVPRCPPRPLDAR